MQHDKLTKFRKNTKLYFPFVEYDQVVSFTTPMPEDNLLVKASGEIDETATVVKTLTDHEMLELQHIFSLRPTTEYSIFLCEPVYRDALIFFRDNEKVGWLNFCFQCNYIRSHFLRESRIVCLDTWCEFEKFFLQIGHTLYDDNINISSNMLDLKDRNPDINYPRSDYSFFEEININIELPQKGISFKVDFSRRKKVLELFKVLQAREDMDEIIKINCESLNKVIFPDLVHYSVMEIGMQGGDYLQIFFK